MAVSEPGSAPGASSGRPMDASSGRVRLAEVWDRPLSVDQVLGAVADPAAGGTCVFVGSVRDNDQARAVRALAYSAHPTAAELLREVCAQVGARHEVVAVAAVHRVGDLAVGDLAVVVAASAGHRGQAFAAARDLIDTLKSTVPIWKHQSFGDGGQEWVGLP
jgi:molybdopterin synthase catalytic subunit